MQKGFVLPLIILCILVFGTVALSYIKYKQTVKSKDFEISQLKEQVKALRDDRQYLNKELTKSSAKQPVEAVEILDMSIFKPSDKYTLECISLQEEVKNRPSWLQTVESKIEDKEHIYNICQNQELKKAIFFSGKPSANMESRGEDQSIKLYDFKDDKLTSVITNYGITGRGGGSCFDFFLWTKNGEVYYKCVFDSRFEFGTETAYLISGYKIHIGSN